VINTASYGAGGTAITGSLTLPAAINVLTTITYGAGGTAYTGSLTLPDPTIVRNSTGTVSTGTYGAGGTSLTPTFANCSSDAQIGCATVTGFPAANIANYSASDLKIGKTAGGIVGTGFTTPTCSYDGQQDCIVNSTGLYKAANYTGVTAWDLRTGHQLAGITGALKTNCRNTVNSSYFNYDGDVKLLPNTVPVPLGSTADIWDTIDDYYGLSSTLVTSWTTATYCDSSTFIDVTTTDGGNTASTCGASNNYTCIFKDQISNLQFTGIVDATGSTTGSASSSPQNGRWAAAVNLCAASTYGGYTAGTWRLPTQKELMSLYEHGIITLASSNFATLANLRNFFWSASTLSSTGNEYNAWAVHLGFGETYYFDKQSPTGVSGTPTAFYTICVK
jgi:hypothetical protein